MTNEAKQAKKDATGKTEEKVTLVEDPKLPAAVRTKIGDTTKHEGKRVRVYGWAHHIRDQKKIVFIEV